ncbi:MAG: DUF4783 domain-containing protein [Bacteroidetes bacterium]|nr:DUF4783 domain-containing protein [Bacteroidota bacterium]
MLILRFIGSLFMLVLLCAALPRQLVAERHPPQCSAPVTQMQQAVERQKSVQEQQGVVEQQSERDARELLLNAKDALSSGNIRSLRPQLGNRVYLNLFTGINGYYSAEQAFLILQSFFSTHSPISFSFSSRNFSIRNPYGFGPLTYERRGRRETAEMFISLALVGERWVINQITVAGR